MKDSVKYWFICFLASFFYGYEFLLRVIPSVLDTIIINKFIISESNLGLIGSMYYFAYTPLQIFVGPIFDYFGIRKPLLMAILFCIMGNLLFSGFHSYYIILLSRFIIGIGSAFAFIGVLKISADYLPHKYFSIIAGVTTAIGLLGAITGQYFFVQISKVIGYQLTLHFISILGVIIFLLLYLLIPKQESQYNREGFNLIKFLMHVNNVVKLCLQNRVIIVLGLIGFCLYSSISLFAELWGARYFKIVVFLSDDTSLLLTSLVFIGWIFGAPLLGALSNIIKRRIIILKINSILALFCIIVMIYTNVSNIAALSFLCFFFGITSSAQILVFSYAADISKQNIRGTNLAIVNLVVMLGGYLQYIVAKLISHLMKHGTSTDIYLSAHSFQIAFCILPILYLLSLYLTFYLEETYCIPAYPTTISNEKNNA
jgi:MFS family permease